MKIASVDNSLNIYQLEEPTAERHIKQIEESIAKECFEPTADTNTKRTLEPSLKNSSVQMARNSLAYLEHLRKRSQSISDVIFQDSSIVVRQFMSMALLLFSFIFMLSTLGSELGERCLDYIFKKIEVTNYFDSARHTWTMCSLIFCCPLVVGGFWSAYLFMFFFKFFIELIYLNFETNKL